MAGYSGQDIALDVDTPSQLEQAAAVADSARTQSQLAKATLPADVQYKQALASNMQSTAEQSALTVDQQKQLWGLRQARAAQMANSVQSSLAQAPQGTATSPLADAAQSGPVAPTSAPLFDPDIDAVIHGFDSSDPQASAKADAKLAALGKAGNPMAAQFIGKINQQSVNDQGGWLAQIGANAVRQASQPQATPPTSNLTQLPPVQPGQSFEQAMAPVGAPGTPYGGAQSPLSAVGAPQAPAAQPSPLTGKVDPVMQQMAVLFPEEYTKQIALEGQMKFLQTGNPNDLERTNPTEFRNLMDAYKAQTDAQHMMIQTRADMMGRAAFAVLDLGHTQSENWLKAHPGDTKGAAQAAQGGAALEAYRTAIIDAANNKWISPEQARARLSQPIDWGFVTSSSIQGQTVSEAYKSFGIEKANEQRAEVNNPVPHITANQVDANGHILQVNSSPAPGQPAITVTGIDAGSKGALTLQAKQNMLIQGGMSPQDAAMYAAGNRPIPPEKILAAADKLAVTEFNAQTTAHLLNPQVQVQSIEELRAQYTQQLSQAGGMGGAPSPTPAPGTSPGAPGTPAPASSHGAAWNPAAHGGLTKAQQAVAQHYVSGKPVPGLNGLKHDPKAPLGTFENPYYPTPATYDSVPSSAVVGHDVIYIGQDGIPRRKP